MAFDTLPRGRDIVGSIRKYQEINDYQKHSIYILKVDYFGQIHIVSQSSLIVYEIPFGILAQEKLFSIA